MQDAPTHWPSFSLRLPPKLSAELKRAADLEANTPSAVARRLIATGLAREAQQHNEIAAPVAAPDAR